MTITNSTIQTHYIIGIGRSGTTLLSKLLNEHKSCLVTLETDFVIFFYQSFKNKVFFTKNDFELVVEYFEVTIQLNPSIAPYFSKENLLNDLIVARLTSFNELIQFIYCRFNFLRKMFSDILCIIDKKPSYSLHVSELLKINPNAKFIYLVRDYRANLLSRKQSVELKSPNIAFNAYRWLFFNRKVQRYKMMYPGKILEIKYEDLVGNSVIVLNQILDFLSLSSCDEEKFYYRNCNYLNSAAGEIKTGFFERSLKIKNDLSKPIFDDRVSAWKRELTEDEIFESEVICGSLGNQIGYQVSSKLLFCGIIRVRMFSFYKFVLAFYDYQKEFVLIRVNAKIKLKRLKSKFKLKISS